MSHNMHRLRGNGKHPGAPPVGAAMTYTRHNRKERQEDPMDRRLIRVEFPHAQAGIAAALRRAFQPLPEHSKSFGDDFDELLSRLN